LHDFISAILLGIVEGITEFLPVSSTGHLLIAEHWLGERTDFFNVVIQAAAFIAVVLIYRQKLWTLFSRWREPENFDYLAKLFVAFVITSVGALTAIKLGFKLPEEVAPIAWAELIGGLYIFAAEWRAHESSGDNATITWKVASSSAPRRCWPPCSPAPAARCARSSPPCWSACPRVRRRRIFRSCSAFPPCSRPVATSSTAWCVTATSATRTGPAPRSPSWSRESSPTSR
jgi:Undecaprenyl-diphosphatase (EC 3.6.1.27)